MHAFDEPAHSKDLSGQPWWRELTRYHWFVLVVAALGWLFDTMDQQLFTLARGSAILELHGTENNQFYIGLATMIFIFGWATGGIIFGILGDRIGRAKTMMLTILLYSFFTGLSALSQSFWDFVAYRFFTGLGVGGEFAVGVALVAEVMPDRARTHALGWLQALSAVGNITAALIGMGLSPLETADLQWKSWRFMFVIGALPALLAILIRRRLQEPERWKAIRASSDQKLGSIRELFGDPRWRRHALVGLVLASSGVVGLWGIGFFSVDLVRAVFRETFEAEARLKALNLGEENLDREFIRQIVLAPDLLNSDPVKQVQTENFLIDPDAKVIYKAMQKLHKAGRTVTGESILEMMDAAGQAPEERQRRSLILSGDSRSTPSLAAQVERIKNRTKEIEGRLMLWGGINGLLLNLGAFFGMYSFSKITQRIGRRPAFAVTFVLALVSTAFTFWNLRQFSDIFWMIPIMGFCQIALFGGYAIYFPELFPTRLRSTGISFCYNVGRYVSAPAPLLLGTLASMVFGQYGEVMSWRYAGVTMCSFFLVGLLALPFAPETKGKPLPE